MMTNTNSQAIGVFDSGVGGLTVLRALQTQLPQESFLYLGDTARVPYGTKSPETIFRYTQQALSALIERGVKCIVIACNTASSVALESLQTAFPAIPILGVVEPGAQAACSASQTGQIAIIATEATVNAGGYQTAIRRIRPQAELSLHSCSLLVALAEEGWTYGPIAEAIVQQYLAPVFSTTPHPDCLVLGCTHFPLFADVIQTVVGPYVSLVDSAKATATATARILEEKNLKNTQAITRTSSFLVTDAPARFARIASHFLGASLGSNEIEWVDF